MVWTFYSYNNTNRLKRHDSISDKKIQIRFIVNKDYFVRLFIYYINFTSLLLSSMLNHLTLEFF